MKSILYSTFLLFLSPLYAQNLDTIFTSSTYYFDFSKQAIDNWNKSEQLYTDVMSENVDYDVLSQKDKELIDNYDETKEDFWQVEFGGCSWYCGAGGYTVSTTSELKFNETINYIPENLIDFNYKTAWAEGINGYGIGEKITFSFPLKHPRITTLLIANGYVKNKNLWKANSRVKTLKMLVNDKPYAILELNDIYAEQLITLEKPLGSPKRHLGYEKTTNNNQWTITFEILDIYKGEKYDDTVISEIYFDGIDVHCLAEGTRITMADGNFKNIELLEIGDKILSYNIKTQQTEISTIKELENPFHKNLVNIKFSNGDYIICTRDHPFLSKNLEWISIDYHKAQTNYQFSKVKPLKIGSQIRTEHSFMEVIKITSLKKAQKTYTIVELDKNKTFFANGILTGVEKLKNH